MKRLVCTICARGGSQGVPGKNRRLIAGRPLIGHSVSQAKEAGIFDMVVVDSDDPEIRQFGLDAGADLALERPAHLATNEAGKLGVIQRALLEAEKASGAPFDAIVDLDATSPLRLASDVIGAVELLRDEDTLNVVSVTPAHRSPYFNLAEVGTDGVLRLSKDSTIVRRQDAPEAFDLNASIYGWKREPFASEPFLWGPKTKAFVMPRERSFDIDDMLDLQIVEMLFADRAAAAGGQ